MNQSTKTETNSSFKDIYMLGGIAALLVALLTLAEVIVFIFYPQPSTVRDWFLLFHDNKIIGLLDFWGLEIPMYLMFIFVFLAFYVALRKTNQGRMLIALTLALLGIAIFLATNNPFSMLSLSSNYATATTDMEKEVLLAAGQALLANTNQRAIGGFNLGFFLMSIAGLLVSSVMLKSSEFSKSTAYIGIVANGLSLADYFRQVLTSSPIVALLVIMPNAIFLIIWFIMVGRRFYRIRTSVVL